MRSLRARLNTAFVLPTAIIVVVLVAVAYVAARQGLEEELGKRLEAVGQVIAGDMSDGVDAAQIERLDESMHRVRARLEERLEDAREATGVRRIFIFDREARSLVDTDSEAAFGDTLYRIQADRSELEAMFGEGVSTTGPLFQADDGAFHKTAYAPIFYEGEVVAAIGVEAGATYFDLLTKYATVLTILGALGVIIIIGMGVWFSKLLSRPVDILVEAAGRLAEGDMDTPVAAQAGDRWSRTDELDFLMASFEEMRQSIVERDQQMQMMLAGIAHEVRNPLGGMELFSGLLKEDLRGEDDGVGGAHKIEMVERIEREIDYLDEVVDNFLDFARPGQWDPERLEAGDLLAEVAEVVEADVVEAGCGMEIDVEPQVELTVDRGRIRRALINVIRNACQACGADDNAILVRCAAKGDERIIEIIDDGCGVDEETVQQLCQPFFTTREKGSGLGLALTHQIVEEHDGKLEIESRIGEGTTVRFILPFDEAVEKRQSQEAKPRRAVPEGWLG